MLEKPRGRTSGGEMVNHRVEKTAMKGTKGSVQSDGPRGVWCYEPRQRTETAERPAAVKYSFLSFSFLVFQSL